MINVKEAKVLMYIGLGLLFAASAYQLLKGNPKSDVEPIPKPLKVEGKTPRGWNWAEEEYIYYDNVNAKHPTDLSDEEIRILREKHSYRSDGSYIHTPGRKVKTREREIQDYIDDNIDDILENYTP